MSTPVTLPALGESVTEGTVSRWLKQVGDHVGVDEALVEVSTDKVDTEIPSPVAGVVLQILVLEDEIAPVGATLAIIGDEGESAEAPAAAPKHEPVPEPRHAQPEAVTAPAAQSGPAVGTEVTLPVLGESVTEGTISRWLKAVGDLVDMDEALVEVSTDKVDTEVPSPVAGTVLEIRVAEDETAPVGAVLAIIGDAAAVPAAPAPAPAPMAAPAPVAPPVPVAPAPAPVATAPAPAAPAPVQRASGDDRGYVTPLVRKLAADKGIDLVALQGTGVGGRIRKEDVLAAAEAKAKAAAAPPIAPAPVAAPAGSPAPVVRAAPVAAPSAKRGTTEKVSRLRATIAKRMKESLQVSAQLTATVEVDLTKISRIRAQSKDAFKAREGASLSYLPFIAKAAVEGLKQFPKLNATIDTDAGQITFAASEDLGIAVDTDKGLLVPVIKDAGDLNVTGLAKRIGDLAARTRGNKVTPDELTGGSFTITNYGSAGTLMDTPIINQPQVAILGIGALVKRPVVVSDKALGDIIAVRDMMYLSLTYDHRLVDGADAARYLSFVKARLEEADFGAEFGL